MYPTILSRVVYLYVRKRNYIELPYSYNGEEGSADIPVADLLYAAGNPITDYAIDQ